MSEQDTHFRGAAKVLLYNITNHRGYVSDDADTTAAQFLYDFALRVIELVPADMRAEWGDPIDCIEHIPDLIAWPHSED
jgi:hypothetical protein